MKSFFFSHYCIANVKDCLSVKPAVRIFSEQLSHPPKANYCIYRWISKCTLRVPACCLWPRRQVSGAHKQPVLCPPWCHVIPPGTKEIIGTKEGLGVGYELVPEALYFAQHSLGHKGFSYHHLTCSLWPWPWPWGEVSKAWRTVHICQIRQQKVREVLKLIKTSLPGGRAHGSHHTSGAFHLLEEGQHLV